MTRASNLRACAVAFALTALLALAAAGCSNSSKATDALRAEGFTHVQTTGWDMWGCAKSDDTCTGFTATGVGGAHVVGAVGCGYWFKGCTVRIGAVSGGGGR